MAVVRLLQWHAMLKSWRSIVPAARRSPEADAARRNVDCGRLALCIPERGCYPPSPTIKRPSSRARIVCPRKRSGYTHPAAVAARAGGLDLAMASTGNSAFTEAFTFD